ncbi:hypothetical protein ACIBBD_34545 [Streptomyces sp. NPDC051315]|uniref:hypothetical protein n=1 Tax=Streptomyces sp. NPDC051315 TaxID=3365650 RepID=UPI0037A18205
MFDPLIEAMRDWAHKRRRAPDAKKAAVPTMHIREGQGIPVLARGGRTHPS